MEQQTNSYEINPLELIDDINSYHECNVDGITTFKNPIPYYNKHAAMNAVLHVIFAIQPFMKRCLQFRNTPFNNALLKLFVALNYSKLSCSSHELPKLNYLELMKLCEIMNHNNSWSKVFSLIRNCIYKGFDGILIDLDFVFAYHETRSCFLCKKNKSKLFHKSSFLIRSKTKRNVENHILSCFSQEEIFFDDFCECFSSIRTRTLLKGPPILTIVNEPQHTVKSLCFGLKPLDLSPYLMNKEIACLYDLRAVLLTNFNPQKPIFAALVYEHDRGWILYLRHYEHLINQNSFNQFAAIGSCRVRLIEDNLEKKEHELYPARLVYIKQTR
jgi:hypothetical protein